MNFKEVFLLTRDLATIVQFLTAVVATIYFYKYKGTFLKYFLILIWYAVLNEFLGIYIRDYVSEHNAIVYNLYYLINFTVLFLIFKNYLKSHKYRLYTLVFTLSYLVVYIINSFFENYLKEFLSWPYILAGSFLIACITFYFIEILNSERVLQVRRNLLFWISIGLLIYYIGNIPFRLVRNYYSGLTDLSILFLINIILTIIMNICFILGFIWSDKKQQY